MADFNSFTIVGYLGLAKNSANTKAYEEKKYDSGWISRTLRLVAVTNKDTHYLTIREGKYEDEHNMIYGWNAEEQNFKIKFEDRFKEIGRFPKQFRMRIDTETYKRRRLANLAKKIMKDQPGDEKKRFLETRAWEFDIPDDDVNFAALEKKIAESDKKYHEFVSKWDYAEMVYKILQNPEAGNVLWKITGKIEYSVNPNTGTVYTDYVPTSITQADLSDKTEYARTLVGFYFTEDGIGEYDEEKGCATISGYTSAHVNKEDRFIPYSFVIRKDEDRFEKMKDIMLEIPDGCEVAKTFVVCDLINSTESKQMTYDDLSEAEKEAVDLEIITLESALATYGNRIAGDRIRENRFKEIGKPKTIVGGKPIPTDYEAEALLNPKKDNALIDDDEDDDALF